MSGSRLWLCYAAKENRRVDRHLTLVFSGSPRFSHSYVFLKGTTFLRSPPDIGFASDVCPRACYGRDYTVRAPRRAVVVHFFLVSGLESACCVWVQQSD